MTPTPTKELPGAGLAHVDLREANGQKSRGVWLACRAIGRGTRICLRSCVGGCRANSRACGRVRRPRCLL